MERFGTVTLAGVVMAQSPTGRYQSTDVGRTIIPVQVARAVRRHSSGALKRAAAPVPSVLPSMPAVPASVVTTPVATTTLRMVLLLMSAT